MKEAIHPKWFAESRVFCACGNTWTTGATIAEIRTDICSACHPFYTGEQRIVDTEGQVDRFMKRLQVRDNRRAEVQQREEAKLPSAVMLSDLNIPARSLQILNENNLNNAADFLTFMAEQGEEAFYEMPGIGRKVIADMKKALRQRGFEIPVRVNQTAD